MEDNQVKKLVNKCFAMKGMPKVTAFAQEFSDGCKLHTISLSLFPTSVLIYFSLDYRTVPGPFQYPVRRECQLPISQIDHSGRQGLELEQNQCHDLFQLSPVGVLLRNKHHEDARQGQ